MQSITLQWGEGNMKHWIAVIAASMILSGCGANFHSINRSFSPSTGESRLIDAKQRAIISIVESSGSFRGICAEPSPDALQATAAAFSGSGSVSKEDIAAALNLATSSTESAASIGLRTQTIQLLRDAYYRICEGFLSKGLDEVSYDVLQRRFQNHMIALLAVEQLTGVVKAEQIALTSQSAADAGAQLGTLTNELRKQRETLNELTKRDQALKDEITALEASIEAQGTPQDEEAKEKLERDQATLKAKQSDKKTLETLVADQQKLVETLQSAVEKASLKTITAQSSTSAQRIGGDSSAARMQALSSEVTNAVTEITLSAINSDYSGQICTEALRRRATRPGDPQSAFGIFCKGLLDQIVSARTGLTKRAIDNEEARVGACDDLVLMAKTTIDKLKSDISVAEANAVLDRLISMHRCYNSPETEGRGSLIEAAMLQNSIKVLGGEAKQ